MVVVLFLTQGNFELYILKKNLLFFGSPLIGSYFLEKNRINTFELKTGKNQILITKDISSTLAANIK